MKKNENAIISIFKIFLKGFKIYFLNLDKFIKYLAFPVLGQVLGLLLILIMSYFYTIHIPYLTFKYSLFDNILFVFSFLLLITLPGFIIFAKAFWDYIIAIAALNSIAGNLIVNSKVDDFRAHNEVVVKRAPAYIALLLVLSIIYLVGSFPLFWVLLLIFLVYSCLSIQVFTLEEDKGAIASIKRSFELVKDNFWRTFLLLILLYCATYWIIPEVITWALEKIRLVALLSYPVESYLRLLPVDVLLNSVNAILEDLTIIDLTSAVVAAFVAFILTGFTLPVRAICCVLLYKDISKKNKKA